MKRIAKCQLFVILTLILSMGSLAHAAKNGNRRSSTPAESTAIDREGNGDSDEFVSRGSQRSRKICRAFIENDSSDGESTRGFVDYGSGDGGRGTGDSEP